MSKYHVLIVRHRTPSFSVSTCDAESSERALYNTTGLAASGDFEAAVSEMFLGVETDPCACKYQTGMVNVYAGPDLNLLKVQAFEDLMH